MPTNPTTHDPCDHCWTCPDCQARWCSDWCDYSHLCGQDDLDSPATSELVTITDVDDQTIWLTDKDAESSRAFIRRYIMGKSLQEALHFAQGHHYVVYASDGTMHDCCE